MTIHTMEAATEFGTAHNRPDLSLRTSASATDGACGRSYRQAMKAFARIPSPSSTEQPTADRRPIHGAVSVGQALAAALRQMPEPGRSVLRPVADDLEGRQ